MIAFLEALASADPAPGGGAVVGLQVAFAAALVAMVCRLSDGLDDPARAADELRREAYALSVEDADAYGALRAAYGLPRGSDEERAVRTEAIQDALLAAADVPLRTILAARRVLAVCDDVRAAANPNLSSDLVVAEATARAAIEGASELVGVNLALVRDKSAVAQMRARLERPS